MKPEDIELLQIPGRPTVNAAGDVVVAVSHPDLAGDFYPGTLRRLIGSAAEHQQGDQTPEPFTVGPRDSSPIFSPDGRTVAFLRADRSGPAQLWLIPLNGGEARKLTDHPLGVRDPVFSPTGAHVAYIAAVPEAGRYGSEPKISPEAEPPRRISRLSYRLDGKGFLVDRPEQVFVVDPAAESPTPVQLTNEAALLSTPAFTPDGNRLVYFRRTSPDSAHVELVAVRATDGDVAGGQAPAGSGELLVRLTGSGQHPVVHGGDVLYVGAEFEDFDYAGRTNGLWRVSLAGGKSRRLTDPETVDVDAAAGPPIVAGEKALVVVLDRGSAPLVAVPLAAERLRLDELALIIGGRQQVTSFMAAGTTLAAVVASPDSPGELLTLTVSPEGFENIRRRSRFAAGLHAGRRNEAVEITSNSPDGYPVHGWLVVPPGPGPHPVLLTIHGGPHAAYGWGFFDEPQVYADAGYAVVMTNPRGSAGYGEAHGRAVLGRLGTIDADDVLALLDVALDRPECDAARVGVMGGSYGGYLSSWLASHAPERFTAAISERAVNAWDSFAGSSDIGYFFAGMYVGSDRDSQWRKSPLAHADRIDLPMLLIHSEQDWRCPVEQAQRLFVALKQRGAPVEMLLFPGEGHELSRSGRPKHRRQRFEAILDWWARYLPVAAHRPAEGLVQLE